MAAVYTLFDTHVHARTHARTHARRLVNSFYLIETVEVPKSLKVSVGFSEIKLTYTNIMKGTLSGFQMIRHWHTQLLSGREDSQKKIIIYIYIYIFDILSSCIVYLS